MFGCHSLVGEGDASEVWWVETRDAAESPTMHKTAPCDRVTWPYVSLVPWLRNPVLRGAGEKEGNEMDFDTGKGGPRMERTNGRCPP